MMCDWLQLLRVSQETTTVHHHHHHQAFLYICVYQAAHASAHMLRGGLKLLRGREGLWEIPSLHNNVAVGAGRKADKNRWSVDGTHTTCHASGKGGRND